MKWVLVFLILITLIGGLVPFGACEKQEELREQTQEQAQEQEELRKRKAAAKVLTGEIDTSFNNLRIGTGRDGKAIHRNVPNDYVYFLKQEEGRIVSVLYDKDEEGYYSFVAFKDTQFEEGIKKKILDLKSGDVKYLSNPPIDRPSDKNQYFFWGGNTQSQTRRFVHCLGFRSDQRQL